VITRTIGGWALLSNALLTFILAIVLATSFGGDTLFQMLGAVLSLLLLVGLPAIWAMQPHNGLLGQIGLIGVWCLGIAAGIALLVRLDFLFSSVDLEELLPLSSALFALLGSLLLGWATIRAAIFHPAIGWLLIVGGVLNFAGGPLPTGSGTELLDIIATLAQVGAIAGYGWTILHAAAPAHHIVEA
jgi:hypothetical protein